MAHFSRQAGPGAHRHVRVVSLLEGRLRKGRILPSPVQAHHRHDTPCLQEEVPHSRVRALLTEAGKRKNGARCPSRRVAGPGWTELGPTRTFPKRRPLTGPPNGLLSRPRQPTLPASRAGTTMAYNTSRHRKNAG